MFELEKVLCGDAGIIKLPSMKFQAVESDEICNGAGAPDTVNESGIVVDGMGVPVGYAINRRTDSGGYVFDHIEDRRSMIFDAYWTRFKSQYRGVSPLSAAINTFQDLHEGFEFNLVKAKMHALFGLAIMRQNDAETGAFGGAGGSLSETAASPATAAQDELTLNPKTINILDLNQGDDVKTIESGTPSTEFIQGSYLFIQIGMLALDIPITCFDSRRSSFSARIADLNEYEVSCEPKRTKNRYVRQAYSDEVMSQAWNDPADPWNLREIATRNGVKSLRQLQQYVEWIPSGAPWLDKYRQVMGDQLCINMMMDNRIDAARRRGADVFENIDKEAQVIAYAKDKGVPLSSIGAGERTVEEVNQEPSPVAGDTAQ
jgi:capsid protein